MEICKTCCQPIKITVAAGQKLFAQVHTGPHTPPGTGRYLTILNHTCACGVRTERIYENRQGREVNRPVLHVPLDEVCCDVPPVVH
jgi:hypothetical protein